MSIAAGSSTDDSYVEFAKMMDRRKRDRCNFIGGFSALVQKGFTKRPDSDRIDPGSPERDRIRLLFGKMWVPRRAASIWTR